MKCLLLLLLIWSVGAQEMTVSDVLKDVKIQKSDMLQMIETLEKSGKISPTDAARAKEELQKMKQSDIDAIEKKAFQMIDKASSQQGGKDITDPATQKELERMLQEYK